MLRETSQEKALRLAAVRPLEECEEIRERIRKAHLRSGHDPDGRPSRLERLVAHIGKHLFEGTLSVEGACKAVGIGDGAIGGELRAYIGYTVDELIDKLRIDTAFPLVAETGFSFGDIAHLVGFRTYRTFTRTYKIWAGEPPGQTRKRYRGGTGDLPVDIPFDFGDFRTLRRVGEGAATPNDLERLHRALSELYPDTFGDRGADLPEVVLPGPPFDSEVLERFQAERVVWPTLAGLSFAEQRRYVRQCRSWTTALFDFLHEKSREEGRRDRQRGIELAQLALDSLDGNDGRLGERIHSLRAQGWAWLGNARRLALDFSGAEAPFRRAEAVIAGNNLKGSRAAGIFFFLKGTLRMFQRRQVEAIALFDSALPPLKRAQDIRFQVKTLLHRALALIYHSQFGEVESTLATASGLLEEEFDEGLAFSVTHTLAVASVRAGEFNLAERQLTAIAPQVAALSRPFWKCQIKWLEAVIDHGLGRLEVAESKYLASWQGFEDLDEPLKAALVLLDLAVLYSEKGDATKVIEISSRICHAFESIKLYEETMAALCLLHDAINRVQVTEVALSEVRSALWRDPLVGLQ